MKDQVPPSDIEHRPDRQESAESHFFTQTPVQDRRTQSPALTDESYVSRQSHRFGEHCVQAMPWNHHADAVRPNQTHFAATRKDWLLQLQTDGAAFAEPG
jgi:hypothetical protein